jgi:hypothetical protein
LVGKALNNFAVQFSRFYFAPFVAIFCFGFENRDEPSESTLVVLAGRAFPVSIDPFRVLREQVFVQLPLQLGKGSSG